MILLSYDKLFSPFSNINLIFQARAIYDVKGIDMGKNLVRYKVEIDFDMQTRTYKVLSIDKHDLKMLEVRLYIFIYFYYALKINLS